MPLLSGTRLGPYEITAPAGAGGMGEVYRARDTRLDRTVAIKVLPAQIASHDGLRQRLEREARAISSLNHPNICTLFDVGHQDGILVMEFLEGETLAQRLTKGPLPFGQAMRYAIEIAGALDRAHRQGIVHRDLKPANVMLTKAGAKLLDFGLAKYTAVTPTLSDNTQTLALTSAGTILGTFQYMAPEQLEGKEADARADIFAFGAVLYEMVTGRKAFEGKSQASLIAAILTAQPPPISAMQALSPSSLDRVIAACLTKDPEDRWRDAGDLKRELEWIGASAETASTKTPQSKSRVPWIAAAVCFAAAVTLAAVHLRETPSETPPVRFTITPEAKQPSDIAISPDGARLAYTGQDSNGRRLIWVRPLNGLASQALAGTEDAKAPFWSPDSRFIAFFTRNHLQKIAAAGGPTDVICNGEFRGGPSGDWNRDGTIIFNASNTEGISRVSSAGGSPRVLLATDKGSLSFTNPQFLNDGRRFSFLRRAGQAKLGEPASAMYVGSLDSREIKRLITIPATGRIAQDSTAPGRPSSLLFARNGALVAQELDLADLQLRGDPVLIAKAVAMDTFFNVADFSASRNGILALNSAGQQSQLLLLDRAGKQLGPSTPVSSLAHPSFAPDGNTVSYNQPDPRNGVGEIWRLDLGRNTTSLLTYDSGSDFPVFSADGASIAFVSSKSGKFVLTRQSSEGGSNPETLFESPLMNPVTGLSPDGKFLAFTQKYRLWILPLTGDRRPSRFYPVECYQQHGQFSPDGKWIAYSSNETGEFEVYVQPFPATGAKWKVSTLGGAQPRWRGDGKEIYYRSRDGKVMAVEISLGGKLEVGQPHMLFQASPDPLYPDLGSSYDVTHDGKRFVMNTALDNDRGSPITVIVNWPAALKR